MIEGEIYDAIKKIHKKTISQSIISWACPVFVFGNIKKSNIATVGINPSNNEFMDFSGLELDGEKRRFPTLKSLGLKNWNDVDSIHLIKIIESYDSYFLNNPYGRWFNKLNNLFSNTNFSYYSESNPICHIDLIPFATSNKWGKISLKEKNKLETISMLNVKSVLKKSDCNILILNGKSVINMFRTYYNNDYIINEMEFWDLKRKNSAIKGFSFQSTISLGENNRKVIVLGFNHNIQSSFGVSTEVLNSISEWINNKLFEYGF